MNASMTSQSTGTPSAASRAMIERLIGFKTVSRDSNLGLIEWVRDYLQGSGAATRLTHDATGKKANLFATLGDSARPGLILSGHTDVVPVDGQNWDTDPFAAVERDGRLYARGSADMKGFIGIILAQAPKFVAALNENRLVAPLHYSLSYDEEVGCLGVRGLIRDLEEQHIKPAGCVVGEPTSMQPIIAHKGTHRFRCACTAARRTRATSLMASMQSNMRRVWWCSYASSPSGCAEASSATMASPCRIRRCRPGSFMAA